MTYSARRLLLALVLLLPLAGSVLADDGPPVKVGLDFFLHTETSYDTTIPKPAETLGYEVAEWHVRHDQLVRYMETLAESSPRVSLELQGRTHEGRPQVLVTITSPENHARLEELRESHLAGGDPDSQPAVVWLGYSIHGDEASGSNASMVVGYHLAAAQGEEVEALLRHTVVLIDPSLNPDGLGRFAQWANGHRGRQPARDPAHREHQQVWPGGRVNHYWFDLNRDWLLLRHPESRNRVETFHRWRPHLLGDFHEMGSNSTYFFQPGVPERKNPLIPDENMELTRRVARFHANALDRAGELYFTEEAFDDFYPGKGSTYPDLNGSVGVLFEQASVRGHRQKTINGTRVFADAVRNQFLTSLSMLEAAHEMRPDLVRYQQDFAAKARSLAKEGDTAGWVFAAPEDPVRVHEILDLLRRHHIEVRHLGKALSFGETPPQETTFDPATSYFVPSDQDSHLLAQALFETRTSFEASTFYDVSAWTLPLAFGVASKPVLRKGFTSKISGDPVEASSASPIEPATGEASDSDQKPTYAYLIDGEGYFAHRALRRLQEQEVRVRVATRPFEALSSGSLHSFPRGTLVVPTGNQPEKSDLPGLVATIVKEDGLVVRSLTSGLTQGGVDLGSAKLPPLRKPRPMLLVGRGVNRYEAGEVWHLLDHRFGMELPMVDLHALGRLDLSSYTHLLMVDGRYDSVGKETVEKVRRWVQGGGVVVATKGAADWAQKALLVAPEAAEKSKGQQKKRETGEKTEDQAGQEQANKPPLASGSYGEFEKERQAQRVSGAIFQAEIDLTHPLAFGYRRPHVSLLRNNTKVLEPSKNPYENVATYTAEPLLGGYSSPENLEKLGGTTALVAQTMGRGAVIRFADNPNFRAFWYGTTKLYLNSIFFSSAIQQTSPPEKWYVSSPGRSQPVDEQQAGQRRGRSDGEANEQWLDPRAAHGLQLSAEAHRRESDQNQVLGSSREESDQVHSQCGRSSVQRADAAQGDHHQESKNEAREGLA